MLRRFLSDLPHPYTTPNLELLGVTLMVEVRHVDWLLKFVVVWLSLGVVVIATGWYLSQVIKPLCPDWWRRVVIDDEPSDWAGSEVNIPSFPTRSSPYSIQLTSSSNRAALILATEEAVETNRPGGNS